MQRDVSVRLGRHGQIEVKWRINNFNLCRLDNLYPDYYIQSSTFLLGNAKYFLGIYPCGCREVIASDWVSLFLGRMDHSEDHSVSFSFQVKPANIMLEDEDHEYTFTHQKQKWLKPRFFKRSLFEIYKMDRALTIICKARLMKDGHTRFEGFHNLSANFEELFLTRHKCDVKLKVQEKVFEAHKLILEARSPVFSAMFQHKMTESISGVVVIPDLNPEHFNDFLRFVYTGKLDIVTSQNAMDLYTAADKYDFIDLRRECILQMSTEFSVDNILEIILFAGTYQEEKIRKMAEEYFIKNAEAIVSTDKWKTFIIENIQTANDLILEMARDMRSNTSGVKRKLDECIHAQINFDILE